MKSIFNLFVILFLSLLLACSEEPPTSINNESLSKKPVPPPPPDPLPALVQGTKYIAGNSGNEIFIWDNGGRIWSSSIDAFSINGFGIGDFIGDADKELLVERRVVTGRGKNKVEKEQLIIFKEGDTEPSQIVELRTHNDFRDAVWDMKIGNVDGDADLEIIILFRDQIEIWEYDDNNNNFYLADFSDYYSSMESPWRADFGDLDNDNVNEIIVSFTGNLWRTYQYDGSSITSVFESSAFTEIGNLDCAKISDVDNDGTVEVVGGNFPDKVLLWEYPYTDPNEIVSSQNFSNAPWAIGIGELDDDPSNGKEIIAGVTLNGGLHLLHYIGGSLIYEEEVFPGISVSLDGIVVSDIDNNNNLEIIVGTGNGVLVLDNSFSNMFSDNVGGLERVICQ